MKEPHFYDYRIKINVGTDNRKFRSRWGAGAKNKAYAVELNSLRSFRTVERS